MVIRPNAQVLRVERGSEGTDRYGQPQWAPVMVHVPIRLVEGKRASVLSDGTQGSIDAEAWFFPNHKPNACDRITMDNVTRSIWYVQTVEEIQTVSGRIQAYKCGLTKQQTTRIGQAD